jgi:uncharacterized protein
MTPDLRPCRAHGTLATDRAPAMLYKLCKHFAKKIPVEFDDTHGHARFPQGDCVLHASDSQLAFECACDDAEQLAALRQIIDLHAALLTRKAPQAIHWLIHQ